MSLNHISFLIVGTTINHLRLRPHNMGEKNLKLGTHVTIGKIVHCRSGLSFNARKL